MEFPSIDIRYLLILGPTFCNVSNDSCIAHTVRGKPNPNQPFPMLKDTITRTSSLRPSTPEASPSASNGDLRFEMSRDSLGSAGCLRRIDRGGAVPRSHVKPASKNVDRNGERAAPPPPAAPWSSSWPSRVQSATVFFSNPVSQRLARPFS